MCRTFRTTIQLEGKTATGMRVPPEVPPEVPPDQACGSNPRSGTFQPISSQPR